MSLVQPEEDGVLPNATKSVLITGANGFVGRSLSEFLLSQNWKVVAAARRDPGALAALGAQVERLTLLESPKQWQAALRSVDCVVHLAARVHRMTRSPNDDAAFNEVNAMGASFVAQQAVLAGVRRFVFLSSIKVNGDGGPSTVYHADDVPHPKDAYGRSKLAAEVAIRDVCTRGGVEYVVLRPPLVYGPDVGANFRRLIRLVDLAVPLPFRSIKNKRSLVGIRNLVAFIETCMVHSAASGRTWLVSDGEDLSTPELMGRLARLMSRRLTLFPFPTSLLRQVATCLGRQHEMERLTASLQLDIDPAASYLNWRPPFSVNEELAKTVAAYRQSGQRDNEL